MAITSIKYLHSDAIIGIWRIDEPESFFNSKAELVCIDPEKAVEIHHPKRRCEWLAGRFLVSELTRLLNIPFSKIYSDEFGKPHMVNSDSHISISHAEPYVVAMVHRKNPCGIDVESLRPKVVKLGPKFLSDKELGEAGNDIRNLTILWGAKEALYKLHGRKRLIFKENLRVHSIQYGASRSRFQGDIIENGTTETVQMHYFSDENHVLVTSS